MFTLKINKLSETPVCKLIDDCLPNTMWELIDLALKDYNLVKCNYKYDIEIIGTDIHSGLKKGKCKVNLIGCLIANTLCFDINDFCCTTSFSDKINRKLLCLDCFMWNFQKEAYCLMHQKCFPIGYANHGGNFYNGVHIGATKEEIFFNRIDKTHQDVLSEVTSSFPLRDNIDLYKKVRDILKQEDI